MAIGYVELLDAESVGSLAIRMAKSSDST